MSTLIELRRDTAANWAATDPVLSLGEPGYDTTNNELRIGDGTSAWSALTPIAGGGGGAGLPLANGSSNFNIATSGGNATITTAGGNVWTFGTDGMTSFPNNELWGAVDQDFSIKTTRTNPGEDADLDIYAADDLRLYAEGDELQLYANTNVFIQTDYNNNSYTWQFNTDGTTIYPTLNITRGDRTGTLTGQTLLFGDASQEALISTPNGDANINQNSQRLVINPGAGAANTAGEGGDIYLYAGRGGSGDAGNAVTGGSGGDIKIRGGLSGPDNNGGYIAMEGGEAVDNGDGGYIEIYGGQSGNAAGGHLDIRGGQGQTSGGDANITGGYGNNGLGGNVNIFGGSSGLGAGSYGNVNINTGNTGNTWRFDRDGNLVLPQGGIINEQANPDGFPGHAIVLTPTTIIDPTQQLWVYPTGGVDFNHLHLTTGNLYNTELFLGNDDLYVKLANTGNVVINSNDDFGNTAQWTFDTVGNITIPSEGSIQTAPGSNGNIFIHPDGTGGIFMQGSTNTLLRISSDIANTSNKIEVDTYGETNTLGGAFIGRFARGNTSSYASVQQDDRLAVFGGLGYGSTDFSNSARGRVTIDAAENWTDVSQGTHVSIWTTGFGSTTPAEMARFGAGANFVLYAGNVTVGNGYVRTQQVLVANLPTPLSGARSFVTDADTRVWGNVAVGGAGNAVPVWADGSAWYIG